MIISFNIDFVFMWSYLTGITLDKKKIKKREKNSQTLT